MKTAARKDASNLTRRTFVKGSAFATATLLAGCSTGVSDNQPTESGEVPAEDATTGPENPADLILVNGEVQTMATDEELVSAVAVRNGQIVYVGDDAGAEALAGSETKVIDLEGMYVLPGFIDAHSHAEEQQLFLEYSLYLNETEPTIEAYQQVMRDYLANGADAEVIEGTGLQLGAFPNEVPYHEFIDEIIPDVPVVIHDISVHGALLNAKAMEEVGLTRDTVAPDGGIIYRDAEGEPTGYVSDCAAIVAQLTERVEYTIAQYEVAWRQFQEEMNAFGITGVQIPGGMDGPYRVDEEELWDMFDSLAESGDLSMRVNLGVWCNNDYTVEEAEAAVEKLRRGQSYNSAWQQVSLAKTMIDGVPEAATALLLEPYDPDAGMPDDYIGPQYCTQDTLNQIAAVVDAAGFQLEVHAMGDGGVRAALDAFEYAREQNGARDSRHQVAHATLIDSDDIARMGELSVIGAMQPMWFYYDPFFSPLEEQMFGEERFSREYRIRDMLDAGIEMTGSVDYPVTLEARPLTGIQAGATQCSPFDGEEDSDDYLRNPEQTVPVIEMIKMYTSNAAHSMFMDDRVGTIEVGKRGDFVVLGQNLLACDVREIANTAVMMTISDGRVVYEGGPDRTVPAEPIQ